MRYHVGEAIGEPGGFGTVYSCRSEVGDEYAIKILKKERADKKIISRFQKEVRLINSLNHPNIIKIIAFDTVGDTKYYIMPRYCCSLAQIVPQLYGNYDRQYKVISEILNGLIYLHEQGILHRDMKPQNILYNSDTDIAINDLGFSRQVDSDSTRLTNCGEGFGSYRYVSPEQMHDAEGVNEKTDIYAMGRIIEDIVTDFSNNQIPDSELRYIIEKCTNPNPEKRFASARELKSILDSVYQKVLKITTDEDIDSHIAMLEMGFLSGTEITELAMQLMSCEDDEKVEKFFFALSEEEYKEFESDQIELAQPLTERLRNYYISQGWGFSYTDTIGSKCQSFYYWSNNAMIKAAFLYAILEVGIWHNRFYVMGIGEKLLREIKNDLAVSTELKYLMEAERVNIAKLDISRSELPSVLQSFY